MKTYRSDWTKEEIANDSENLRVEALEPTWDLSQGWHPDVEVDSSFYDAHLRKPLRVRKVPDMPPMVGIGPMGAVTGHIMMKDGNTAALTQPDKSAPIAPLFARDLAGRIIYIGTTRHKQNRQKDGQKLLMPEGSALFDESAKGHNLLERVFYCCFRFVEMSNQFLGSVSGEEGVKASVTYFAQNLYPYKLRLDSFYQDGWRIPQTERLFVTPVNDTHIAERTAADLMKLWNEKPEAQTYEEFIEANEKHFTDFFKKGCTLIPTLEGFNGLNKVDDDFNHMGFWSGRAVMGLHEIVSHEASDAPQGTILKVLEPGYVTAQTISPARVIVSDGQQYKAAEEGRYAKPRPSRLYPDLQLPHQRLSSKWGAAWLPQHPADFEEPAIWNWEEESSGRFVQVRGPVWDPLHYYYACTQKVIESFTGNRLKKNPNLVKVPEEMLTKFYPVTEVRGFDSINVPKKKREVNAASLIPTTIYHHDDPSCICAVGYHPLPIAFEYELDNWWFPDLAPKYRVSQTIPLNIEKNLAEVVRPNISPDRYIATVTGDDYDAPWVKDPLLLAPARADHTENYPYLKRYLEPEITDNEVASLILPYLEAVDAQQGGGQLPTSAVRTMEENWPGLYQVYSIAGRKAEQVVRFRHDYFKTHFADYVRAIWKMTTFDELFSREDEFKDPKKNLPSSAVTGTVEF